LPKHEFLKKLQKFATIALNMNNEKGCLRFSTFIFMILPNLAKYTMDDRQFSNITKLKK